MLEEVVHGSNGHDLGRGEDGRGETSYTTKEEMA
jgi:hypothetical protein